MDDDALVCLGISLGWQVLCHDTHYTNLAANSTSASWFCGLVGRLYNNGSFRLWGVVQRQHTGLWIRERRFESSRPSV